MTFFLLKHNKNYLVHLRAYVFLLILEKKSLRVNMNENIHVKM